VLPLHGFDGPAQIIYARPTFGSSRIRMRVGYTPASRRGLLTALWMIAGEPIQDGWSAEALSAKQKRMFMPPWWWWTVPNFVPYLNQKP